MRLSPIVVLGMDSTSANRALTKPKGFLTQVQYAKIRELVRDGKTDEDIAKVIHRPSSEVKRVRLLWEEIGEFLD